jgi:hypothetical protein
MRFRILHLLAAFALLGALTSCNYLRALTNRDKVAKVGNRVLYERDLRKLIPAGTSSEDSAKMVQQYINSWALSNLLLMKAEKELSKPEKDVSEEVENFRKVLLGYRYENSYVETHLDTVITAEECQKYYEEHQNAFLCTEPVVRARIVGAAHSSVNYAEIKKNYNTDDPAEEESLRGLCQSSSESYDNFGGNYVSLESVAVAARVPEEECEALLKKGNSFSITGDAFDFFVKVYEKHDTGEVSPYEFEEEKIKEAILSKRKQDLLETLERDLLDDAQNTHKFKIYKK